MVKEVKKLGPIKAFLKPMRRYIPSVFFPTLFFGMIFLDWNHTRQWKAEKALERQQFEKKLEEALKS